MENKKIKDLLAKWQKRNIEGYFCENIDSAKAKILEIIPKSASVGFSGSVTLDSLGIFKLLEERGNKNFYQYRPGLTPGESKELRKQGSSADYYLASANAISRDGELVFFSAFGNRIAGISSANNVIVVCGINKLTPDINEAVRRAREYATPLNCRRLNWNTPCFKDGICRQEVCFFPEYKRMCGQLLIIEAEVITGRIKVILVNGTLGF